MINRVILVGRLTRDPELRYTPSGVAVANFTIAVNRPFSNQQGEREADFIQAVAWRKVAENTANYVGKGSLVGIDGRLQTRSYEKDGQRHYITEVVADSVQFLEPKKGSNSGGNSRAGYESSKPQSAPKQADDHPFDDDPFVGDGQAIDISDDDLPF